MRLNNFSVQIPEGREIAGGYVIMAHHQQYTIVLRNDKSVRCNATVSIDGKTIGTYRINAYSTINLEHASNADSGRFTFYRVGTQEAQQVDTGISRYDQGLISVMFTSERIYTQPAHQLLATEEFTGPVAKGPLPASLRSSAGITGLSGYTNQGFVPAQEIELDHTSMTIINLRLVSDVQHAPRPLMPCDSTPIPPPV